MIDERLYKNFAFILLCISSFLFFTSFNMYMVVFDVWIAEFIDKKYIMLAFLPGVLVALFARPFSGKLSDLIGRKPIIIFGAVASIVCSLAYPLVGSIYTFVLIRAIHGLGPGFNPTGASAYIADIVPDDIRGEAMGWVGLFTSVGLAFGPFFGELLTKEIGRNQMSIASAAMAFSSILIIWKLKETLENPKKLKLNDLKISRREIFDKDVYPAFIVMICLILPYGITLTLIPDYCNSINIKDKSYFYIFFMAASILFRLAAGKLSDKLGREKLLIVGSIIIAISCFLFALFPSNNLFYFYAALYGVGGGISSTSLFAWAIDLSQPHNKGKGMSTLYIGVEIGILLGITFGGIIFSISPELIQKIFLIGTVSALISLIYLLVRNQKSKQPAASLN